MADYGFTVEVTVKEIKGKCSMGHKIGDKVIFDGLHVKGKICCSALASIFPTVYAFMWGADFPWDRVRDITTAPCLDEKNQVVFELKRNRKCPWFKNKERP